jgi:hypothetical protein
MIFLPGVPRLYTGTVFLKEEPLSLCLLNTATFVCCAFMISYAVPRLPLWSSGQSSWLQIQRSGSDYWRYHIF